VDAARVRRLVRRARRPARCDREVGLKPPSPPAAVVFDCDGLLLETESCWTLAEEELFARHGKVFGAEEKRVLIGTSAYAGSLVLERLLELPGQAEPLGLELLELVERRLLEESTAFPGAEALVLELKGRVPIAVASNTPYRLVQGALACAGMLEHFEVVVTGDQVPEPKPSPDVYLRACALRGAAPSRSIGLEDSPTGVAAARAAGMFVIGIPSFPGVLLDEADLVGASLTDPRVREAVGL
jgi:HAD superfamily hydrolase (TIGR01509 family)